jgi:hypothetical protein
MKNVVVHEVLPLPELQSSIAPAIIPLYVGELPTNDKSLVYESCTSGGHGGACNCADNLCKCTD